MIPAAVIELDEPHSPLSQAPRKQAVTGKGTIAGFAAIEIQGLGRFVREIHQVRHARLHFKSHFILCNARGDLRIPRERCLQIVECLHGIHHIPLARGIHAAGPPHVHHRISSGPQLDTLKLARQKSRMPHAYGDRLRTAPRMRTEYHEPRQILRLAAKSVLDPRAHTRPTANGGAGVHEGVSRIMVDRIGVHRTNHREIINMLGKMRKERGHLRAALAEFFKRKLRSQTGELLVLQLRDRLPLGVRCWHRLAVQLHQLRFVRIKRLQMRWTAGHVQIDDPLHLRRMMQRSHHARPTLRLAARTQSGERHAAQTQARPPEESAAI